MSLYYLAILAVVQGITEFLPISSSAHLILLPKLLGVADQGLEIDVAVHAGTLGAVIIYFRSDVAMVARGVVDAARGRLGTEPAQLFGLLSIATVPVVLAGLVLSLTGLAAALRSIEVIGWTTLIFGGLLYWADQAGGEDRGFRDWSVRSAVVMGLWQAAALVPGVSRSGVTITAARLLGYTREDGTRIAMLMSIPTILASEVLVAAELTADRAWSLAWDSAVAAALAFAAAYAALAVMMRLLRTVSFTPYVIYRMVLGVVLLAIVYL